MYTLHTLMIMYFHTNCTTQTPHKSFFFSLYPSKITKNAHMLKIVLMHITAQQAVTLLKLNETMKKSSKLNVSPLLYFQPTSLSSKFKNRNSLILQETGHNRYF